MNPAAKSRAEKEKHPERYCKAKHCLWRTHHADGTRKSFCRNHPEPTPKPGAQSEEASREG